jgi:hypothetical protein
MASRLGTLRDAAVTLITAATVSDPIVGTTFTVSAVNVLEIDPDEMGAGECSVMVRGDGWADGGAAARGYDATDFRLQIAMVEMYTAAGAVTTTWLDTRVGWFEANVTRALGDARDLLSGAYALSVADVEIETEELADKWIAWLQAEVVIRDERAAV